MLEVTVEALTNIVFDEKGVSAYALFDKKKRESIGVTVPQMICVIV